MRLAADCAAAQAEAMIEHLCDDLGVVLRRDMVAAGIHDSAIRRLCRGGVLVRLRHGVYALAGRLEQSTPRQRHAMLVSGVMRLYGDDVALSHTSASLEYGSPDWQVPLGLVHMTDLFGAGERTQASVRHHHGECDVHDVTRRNGHWITTPIRTALDVASVLPREAAVCTLDWFLNQSLVTRDELSAALERRTQWQHHLDVMVKLDATSAESESVGESRARLLFQDHGLPRPVLQLDLFEPDGTFIGRVDFAWPERKVIVEFDGKVKYREHRRPGESVEEAVMREKRREDRLRAQGWLVVRMTWQDLEHPGQFVARLRTLVARAAA
ncbi:type IV toxin-antitoxin system AbiEi family antitoxin domain-containing protein [Nocardioides ginkgobilobae]